MLDIGAVVADDVVDTDAPLGAGAEEPKGDLLSPPPPNGDFDAPTDMPPKPNDAFVDEGGVHVGAVLVSNGLDTLYFCANFVNISVSLPLYFSKVLATSGIF